MVGVNLRSHQLWAKPWFSREADRSLKDNTNIFACIDVSTCTIVLVHVDTSMPNDLLFNLNSGST